MGSFDGEIERAVRAAAAEGRLLGLAMVGSTKFADDLRSADKEVQRAVVINLARSGGDKGIDALRSAFRVGGRAVRVQIKDALQHEEPEVRANIGKVIPKKPWWQFW